MLFVKPLSRRRGYAVFYRHLELVFRFRCVEIGQVHIQQRCDDDERNDETEGQVEEMLRLIAAVRGTLYVDIIGTGIQTKVRSITAHCRTRL